MSQAGDSAEEIVKIVLDGTEVAVKIVGENASQLSKEFIAHLIRELRSTQNSKGRQTLKNIMKSGEPVKTFLIDESKLKRFAQTAKKYGVPYHVIKEKNDKRNVCTILVKASDSASVNHIFETYGLARKMDAAVKKSYGQKPEPDIPPQEKQDIDKFIDALFSDGKQNEKSYTTNPTIAKTEKSRPSERSSGQDKAYNPKERVSVRAEMQKSKRIADKRNRQISEHDFIPEPRHKGKNQRGR